MNKIQARFGVQPVNGPAGKGNAGALPGMSQAARSTKGSSKALPEPALESLSKDQLITLIRRQGLQVKPLDIARIVWERENHLAMRAMKLAQRHCEEAARTRDDARYRKAREEWQKASQRVQAADAYFRRWIEQAEQEVLVEVESEGVH